MGRADTSTKFTLVQALRGFAALWVVLFHAAEGKHLESIRASTPTWLFNAVFEWGHYGVSIFFALSGFVIAHSLRNASATPRYVGKFIVRRSIRLDPPYWATIALMIIQQSIEARIKGTVAPDISGAQLFAHLFYAQDLTGYTQINVVFWTLCFEIQFYVGFMLLLMIERMIGERAGWIVKAVMLGAALAGALQLYKGLPGGVALIMWHSFFVGVAAYWAGQGSRAWVAALALLVLAILAGQSTGAMMSAATAVLLYFAFRSGRIATMMGSKPLQWLGMVSYSLYLTHNIFTGSAYWAMRKVMPAGLASEAVQLVLATGICLVGAYALWWLVERPAHDFAKRIGASHKLSNDGAKA
jgi:peptidoglycan/LPS O-acetylase OafA/YrhL